MPLSVAKLRGEETVEPTGPYVIKCGDLVWGLFDDAETALAEMRRLEAGGYSDLVASLVQPAPAT